MRKTTKLWLVIAATLVVIGCILFAGVMAGLSWDFTKLSTAQYETNTYVIDKEFRNISMHTDTADILFVLSDDGKCKVECYEEENAKHSVTVKDDTLTVELPDERSFSDYIGNIGINIGSPKITLYLPKAEYTSLVIDEATGDVQMPKDFSFRDVDISLSTGDVDFRASASARMKIKTSTGHIRVENISAGALSLSVSTGMVTATGVNCQGELAVHASTGKVLLTDIRCADLISEADTGDIFLKNVIAAERFSIERSTGDVRFEGCDAAEISVETDTGDVTGTLLSEKMFFVETDTGKVNVPKSKTGGVCEIETDTGDIKLDIP